MIEAMSGDLLHADAEALVNAVNCVGVMGRGIALQFRKAYPENYYAYRKACTAGEVLPGRMFTFPTGLAVNPKYIINFPTKRHWKDASRIEDVYAGLRTLTSELDRLGIKSIAVPPLGCGNGGLDWADVEPLIRRAFSKMADLHVQLFVPQIAPGAV
jgi:O-acetyl-ADP-ribose deacetylase (regulator of RNase III)